MARRTGGVGRAQTDDHAVFNKFAAVLGARSGRGRAVISGSLAGELGGRKAGPSRDFSTCCPPGQRQGPGGTFLVMPI